MKLVCTVKVNYWVAPGKGEPSKRSCLAIGRQSVKDDELFILLQTLQNTNGTKYKVNDNISKVFTKFVDDGKATIRFNKPPHDLIIQGDAIQLKSFLHVLKLGLEKKTNLSILPISNLKPKKLKSVLSKAREKIVINKASQYPVLEGFPRTCVELHIVGIERKTFDRQILKLQSLRILNLSQNNLTTVPKELGNLVNLQELNLTNNQLGKAPLSKWSWIDGINICKSLQVLSLKNNQITVLPHQLGKLASLKELDISSNLLRFLPQSIGFLTGLDKLDISDNQLQFLPGSMKNLKLELLDISHNDFKMTNNFEVQNNFEIPSLVEIAARAVIQSRKHYNASMIPLTLVTYLDHAKYCVCGKPCFECSVRLLVLLDMSTIAHSVRSTANQTRPFDCYFCSPTCLRRYAPRAMLT